MGFECRTEDDGSNEGYRELGAPSKTTLNKERVKW